MIDSGKAVEITDHLVQDPTRPGHTLRPGPQPRGASAFPAHFTDAAFGGCPAPAFVPAHFVGAQGHRWPWPALRAARAKAAMAEAAERAAREARRQARAEAIGEGPGAWRGCIEDMEPEIRWPWSTVWDTGSVGVRSRQMGSRLAMEAAVGQAKARGESVVVFDSESRTNLPWLHRRGQGKTFSVKAYDLYNLWMSGAFGDQTRWDDEFPMVDGYGERFTSALADLAKAWRDAPEDPPEAEPRPKAGREGQAGPGPQGPGGMSYKDAFDLWLVDENTKEKD